MMMKKTLMNLVLGTALALAGCNSAPEIVRDFSSVNGSKEYLDIQRKIYNRGVSKEVIEKVKKFYNCNEEEAVQFAKAQTRVYKICLQKETPAVNILGFADAFSSRIERGVNLSLAMDELEKIATKLDSERAKGKYEELERKLKDNILEPK